MTYYITKDNQGIYCVTKTVAEGDTILSKHATRDEAINHFYNILERHI